MVSAIQKLYYYINDETPFPKIIDILKSSCKEEVEKSIKLAFFTRDPRKNGKGYRKIGRSIIQWIFIQHTDDMYKYVKKIPEYGRWDDLFELFPNVLPLYDKTFVERNYSVKLSDDEFEKLIDRQKCVVYFYINQLKKDQVKMRNKNKASYAAKWMPNEKSEFNRKYGIIKTICESWKMSPKVLRKNVISPLRNHLNIVERKMCDKKPIDFDKISRGTLYRYRKSFTKLDKKKFNRAVKKPRVKQVPRILPHEMCMNYNIPFIEKYSKELDLNIEHSWLNFIDKHRDKKIFENSITIIDTNERMKKEGELYEYNCKYFMNVALSIALFTTSINLNEDYSGKVFIYNRPLRIVDIDPKKTLNKSLEHLMERGVCGQFLTQKNITDQLTKYEKCPKNVYIITNKIWEDVFEEFDEFEYEKPFKKKKQDPTKIYFWN